MTPWTVARQFPLSMEFSRQEYWSGLPFPTPGALSDPGIKPKSLVSPALAGGFFITKPPENPMCVCAHKHICIKNHHFCKKLVGGSTEDRCVCGVPELQIGWRYCPKPGDSGSVSELGKYPGEGNSNALQYSCLENPMDGGAWWATVHGVTKSWIRLTD